MRATKPDKAAERRQKAHQDRSRQRPGRYCLAMHRASTSKAPADSVIALPARPPKGDPQSLPAWTLLAQPVPGAGNDTAKVVLTFQACSSRRRPTSRCARRRSSYFLAVGRPDAAARRPKKASSSIRPTPTCTTCSATSASSGQLPLRRGRAGAGLLDRLAPRRTRTLLPEDHGRCRESAGQPDTARLLKWARLGVNKYPGQRRLCSGSWSRRTAWRASSTASSR